MKAERLLWGSRAVSIVLAFAAAAWAQFTPAPGSPLAVGSGPQSVAVGDFNGDGKPDLAIVNRGSNNITVLLGNETGWFTAAPGSPFPTGTEPYSVAVGDFNGDGKLDLAIANLGSNTVTVLLGNGSGGFTAAAASPFSAGTEPCSVAVGDFNGDGHLDLAIANRGSNNVTVLLGNGSGGFTPARNSPVTVGGQPYSLAVGDFNGDGRPDLAVANYAGYSVTVLLGNGAGGFTTGPGSPLTVGLGPTSVAVGDFDGDGKLDLATANGNGDTVTVLLGNGTGGFTTAPGSPFAVGTSPSSVAVGDFNKDGKPDLAVTTQYDSTVTVLLGNGAGGFTAAPGSPFVVGPTFVAVADLNGDGKPDLAIASGAGNNVTVLLNTYPPLPPAPALLSPGNGATGVSLTAALGWNASSGATSYDVYFGTSSPPPLATNTTGTSYAPGTLAQGTLYFWRVVAKNNSGLTTSATWSFTTLVLPPAAPVLTSPANGATGVTTAPTLTWNASAGATSYDVYLGTASKPPLAINTTGTSYAPATLAPGALYFWQVVAKNGGASNASATWSFTTQVPPPAAPALVSPANGSTGALLAPTLTWNASSGATSYDVYFGTLSAPPQVTTATGTSYTSTALTSNTTYYWQIVARNGFGSASSAVWSFTTGAARAILRFVPVTPCRVVDTRFAGGPLAANSSRSFPIPQSGCGIPATAEAYSLNVTVVPAGRLSFLTLWPTGQPQPFVSTLNSFAGTVVANAAIVPAGTNGAVSVYVSDQSDVILDIDGYFDASGTVASYSFYPATPCRVADTRNPAGEFGGPALVTDQTRDFPIPLSSCEIPATATAYSLNVTAIPETKYLGYLTISPTSGFGHPAVSTLNSWTGKVVANAALVPAGSNGSVSVFVTDPANVILDINGYFGQPGGAGELAFYPLVPCRVVDTRNAQGAFGGPEMEAQSTRSFVLPAGSCNVPSTAKAYSLNVTVVPDGPLPFLTAWPTGAARPNVSTLNSFDGSVVANAAIVPAGTNGAISIYVTDRTQVILDINGYFAP